MKSLLFSIYFALFTILVFLSIVLAILTAVYQDSSPANPVYRFAINNHITILIFSICIAIGYGFFWSTYLQQQIKKKQTDISQLINLVKQFLSPEEKIVIEHLISNNGKSTQAEIARLDNMGRVKALRTCQKLQDRNLITITAHGKMRKIKLTTNIVEEL